MIDTKELRPAVKAIGLNGISTQEVLELLDRLEAAEKERDDVAQQLVQSEQGKRKISEECDELRNEIACVKEVEFPRKAQAVADAWKGKCERLEAERDALRAELNEIRYGVAVAHDTIKALRAKIEQMERQEPAYWGPKHAIEGGSTTVIVGKFPVNPTDAPLYALPGAKGE